VVSSSYSDGSVELTGRNTALSGTGIHFTTDGNILTIYDNNNAEIGHYTAIASEYYVFDKWTINNENVTEGQAGAYVVANFRQIQYTLRFHANDGEGEDFERTVNYSSSEKFPSSPFTAPMKQFDGSNYQQSEFLAWATTSTYDDSDNTYYTQDDSMGQLSKRDGAILDFYAHYVEPFAILTTGSNFNKIARGFAPKSSFSGTTSTEYYRLLAAPDSINSSNLPDKAVLISAEYSPHEIYAFPGTAIGEPINNTYIYSEYQIYFNANSSGMFSDNWRLISISATADWKTTIFRDLHSMFSQTRCLQDYSVIENWDVSSVTDMGSMFYYAGSFASTPQDKTTTRTCAPNLDDFNYDGTPLDLSKVASWDVSSVTNMYGMFESSALSSVGFLKDWDVSNVTDFRYTFYTSKLSDASALEAWNVRSDAQMYGTFHDRTITPSWYTGI